MPPTINYEKRRSILRLHEAGMSTYDIVKLLKISYQSAYKYSRELEDKKLDFTLIESNEPTEFSNQVNHNLESGWSLFGTTQVLIDVQSPTGFKYIQTMTKKIKVRRQRSERETGRKRGRPRKKLDSNDSPTPV